MSGKIIFDSAELSQFYKSFCPPTEPILVMKTMSGLFLLKLVGLGNMTFSNLADTGIDLLRHHRFTLDEEKKSNEKKLIALLLSSSAIYFFFYPQKFAMSFLALESMKSFSLLIKHSVKFYKGEAPIRSVVSDILWTLGYTFLAVSLGFWTISTQSPLFATLALVSTFFSIFFAHRVNLSNNPPPQSSVEAPKTTTPS